MGRIARFVIAHRWGVVLAWLVLALAGGYAAPHATSALTHDFSLPGQPGYEANRLIAEQFHTGGDKQPILMVVSDTQRRLEARSAEPIVHAITTAVRDARVVSFADTPSLLSADHGVGAVQVYPRPYPGAKPYAETLPRLKDIAAAASRTTGVDVEVTGQDALESDGGPGGVGVLAETVFGTVGALVVLLLVFGSALAVMPLVIALCSILTTFLIVWGLTQFTDISFIVQFLLALIGLGVAIDYALLIVTRWREERGRGLDNVDAVRRAMTTAGRAVLFSGVTVAVSLAALIVLPVPFLRSVGFTGLLIPIVSVAAASTLLPALLVIVGPRLTWPNHRSADPESRLWRRVGAIVVRHRILAAVLSAVVLLALAAPVFGLRLAKPANDSLASVGGPAAAALTAVDASNLGAGLTHPVEIVTAEPQRILDATRGIDGVAGAVSPPQWRSGGHAIVDVWTRADTASASGAAVAEQVRSTARDLGAVVGGTPAQNSDFMAAVYGNSWFVIGLVVVVTLALLTRAFGSIVLPLKALVLNVLSLGAAYGVTVLIWQHGIATTALFGQTAAGALPVWVPMAVFAFLFGLSMDYEVFLLSRIREEHDAGHSTDAATVRGLASTGRLVSAALILFLAFVSLSRVPTTDVKILATTLAFGIIIDATIVRGVLAPALVAALGPANWWRPGRRPRDVTTQQNPPELDEVMA